MKPTALLERIGQAIASVGKKPDEQLSLMDLMKLNGAWYEAVHQARFEVCPHSHVIKGTCMECAHAVPKEGEDVKQPQAVKKLGAVEQKEAAK